MLQPWRRPWQRCGVNTLLLCCWNFGPLLLLGAADTRDERGHTKAKPAVWKIPQCPPLDGLKLTTGWCVEPITCQAPPSDTFQGTCWSSRLRLHAQSPGTKQAQTVTTLTFPPPLWPLDCFQCSSLRDSFPALAGRLMINTTTRRVDD